MCPRLVEAPPRRPASRHHPQVGSDIGTSRIASEVSDAAESIGVEIPDVDDLVDKARGPLDAFNRSLDATGRRVVGIDANPDGTITIRTAHTA